MHECSSRPAQERSEIWPSAAQVHALHSRHFPCSPGAVSKVAAHGLGHGALCRPRKSPETISHRFSVLLSCNVYAAPSDTLAESLWICILRC